MKEPVINDMSTLNNELHAQIELWRFRAIAALALAAALAFLLVCFGAGQFFFGQA
jgi:hypothetical protein